VVNLILSGGEPLLREDLFEIVEFAKEKNLFVGIMTNGTLIGTQQASKLKNSGVDYVQISVESPDETEHDALRGRGTFKKCLESIRLLKEQGYRQDQLYITATTTRKNIAGLRQYAEFAERLSVMPGTSFFQPVGRGHCNKVSLACSEREIIDFILCRMKEKKEAMAGAGVDIPVKRVADGLIPRIINCCGMGHKTLGIKENGAVVPCHLFFSGAEYEVGNILDDNITEKLFSFSNSLPTVDEIEECKDCNVRYFCGNGCWAHAYWAYGQIGRRSPYCGFYKKYFSAVLWNLGMEDTMTRIYDELNRTSEPIPRNLLRG
jgi:radical SAM protein with 4Fe4S-binding SPASM domain